MVRCWLPFDSRFLHPPAAFCPWFCGLPNALTATKTRLLKGGRIERDLSLNLRHYLVDVFFHSQPLFVTNWNATVPPLIVHGSFFWIAECLFRFLKRVLGVNYRLVMLISKVESIGVESGLKERGGNYLIGKCRSGNFNDPKEALFPDKEREDRTVCVRHQPPGIFRSAHLRRKWKLLAPEKGINKLNRVITSWDNSTLSWDSRRGQRTSRVYPLINTNANTWLLSDLCPGESNAFMSPWTSQVPLRNCQPSAWLALRMPSSPRIRKWSIHKGNHSWPRPCAVALFNIPSHARSQPSAGSNSCAESIFSSFDLVFGFPLIE